jgi:hypothetical protein
VQCPFDGIRFSRDNSATWTAPRQNMSGPTDNLFGETCLNNTKVKFGAPHAVDFGQNNHFSPDGRLYIVGHGAESPESHQAWMQVRALCAQARARACARARARAESASRGITRSAGASRQERRRTRAASRAVTRTSRRDA